MSRDSEALKEQINKFISSYNDIQDYILEKTKITVEGDDVKTSVLSGNSEVYNLDTKLRALVFNQIENLGGEIFRLEHMGIDFIDGTSKLGIKDADALDSALSTELDTLEQFFMGDVDGDGGTDESFSSRMEAFVENYIRDDGILDIQMTTLADRNKAIDERIVEMERRLEFTQSALESSFIAMENAQSNIQSQSAALDGLTLNQ
ncbi:MAG: flagellar filament capping protein FliD [Opitutales bacterium]